ncbi:polyamine aminopropyltransferase [Streptomyces antimicrobicus]|uniref:Polyamine aminopropyltransferase n=1 Tax=Streptomyces antimicrobicus TaxID=2883108 RepID=A0ABS8B6P9_9ACTN|nr:polyamine aminopropyltransferase [Streptomyces antimicrobicus]MCB5180289.1 polyamine aminopropyltransferase [Streptomyces antimicrobicus]
MIDRSAPRGVLPAPRPRGVATVQAALPVRPRTGRLLVLATVFVCAACGLVYELELLALASYLIGDSVTQTSVVLSVMVFAMGVGSLLAKRLRGRPAVGFAAVEAALALLGGLSATSLYASFAWLGEARPALVAFSLAIGVLIGAEIPLLMTLIQRVRRQDAGGAVADLFAADYVGALVGGLAFPFLLLPLLGQLTGAMLTGTVNAAVGGALVLWLFRRDLSGRARWLLLAANVGVLAVLASATLLADDFERVARRAVYGGDVRVALQTGVQELVLTGPSTGSPRSLDLYLDGRLRVSGYDEYRYHEALVHPAMTGPHGRVLVLGGGDGLAAREVLRHPDVARVTVVDLDPGVVRLARTDPMLSVLNAGAYGDPRVEVVTTDAFRWLRGLPARQFDVIVSDLPDPGITPSTKLYSQEFYGLAARALRPGGRIAVHAGSLTTRPHTFWTVEATLRAAGLATAPYSAGGRLSGFAAGPDRTLGVSGTSPQDWGFVLAAVGHRPELRVDRDTPALRSLSTAALRDSAREAEHQRIKGLPPSTLPHPRYSAS